MPVCPYCHDDPDRQVCDRWVFTLPIEAKSQNRLSGNKGVQRWAYQAHRKDLEYLVKDAAQRYDIMPATGKRRVTLTRLYGHGGRDMDLFNLIGGLKPVLDALVRAGRIEEMRRTPNGRKKVTTRRGLLWDDSPKWCIPHAAQRKALAGEQPGILVELEEL